MDGVVILTLCVMWVLMHSPVDQSNTTNRETKPSARPTRIDFTDASNHHIAPGNPPTRRANTDVYHTKKHTQKK